MVIRGVGVILMTVVLAASSAAGATAHFTCPLSPLEYGAPDAYPADRGLVFWWYVSADRHIWAAAAYLKAGDNKVPWIRPKGTKLQVTSRRLDANGPPGTAAISDGYGGQFQASGLWFPSEGCWEVTAKSGASEMTFVTFVRRDLRNTDDAT